jgi:hypothetical protein
MKVTFYFGEAGNVAYRSEISLNVFFGLFPLSLIIATRRFESSMLSKRRVYVISDDRKSTKTDSVVSRM